MNKPKDLTDKEWEMEKKIGNVIFILVGIALTVAIVLLMMEGR